MFSARFAGVLSEAGGCRICLFVVAIQMFVVKPDLRLGAEARDRLERAGEADLRAD